MTFRALLFILIACTIEASPLNLVRSQVQKRGVDKDKHLAALTSANLTIDDALK